MANRTKYTPTKRKRFLEALEYNGNVTEAVKAARIDSRKTVYNWREKYPDFAEDWESAYQSAVDRLEQEAWRRATEGTEKPVYQNGQLVGHIQQYSDTLLIFLMKGHNPERYKDRQTVEHSGGIEVTDAKDRLGKLVNGSEA